MAEQREANATQERTKGHARALSRDKQEKMHANNGIFFSRGGYIQEREVQVHLSISST